MTAELVTVPGDVGAPVIRRAAGVTIDQIVQAWLDAQRASARTRRAYADAVASFRAALQAAGQDLDAAPRRWRWRRKLGPVRAMRQRQPTTSVWPVSAAVFATPCGTGCCAGKTRSPVSSVRG